MRRVIATLGVVALLSTALVAMTSTTAGAAQVCTPPGNDGTAGLTAGPSKKGDFDGDGMQDEVQLFYDTNDDFYLLAQVTLANGYQTFYEWTGGDALGPIASFFKIRDIDRDGDHEIMVNIFPQDPNGPVDLLSLADCNLVKATLPNGTPLTLYTGSNSYTSFGLDCFSPSAAGKGVTQYTSVLQANFVDYEMTRTEYRLKVDESAGEVVLKKTRETVRIFDGAHPLLTYASSVHCGAPPKCDGKKVTIQGTPFNDKVNGTNTRDRVASLGGNDTIDAKKGNDLVCAGSGKDTINAGDGADTVLGQDGNDTMNGGNGNDTLKGGRGKDTANGGKGNDTCVAETKNGC